MSKNFAHRTSKVDRVCDRQLINRRVSVGVEVEDVCTLFIHHDRLVGARDIDNRGINYAPILKVGQVAKKSVDESVIIMNQHACHYKGKAIHSSRQVTHFKNFVDDTSIKVGDNQCVLSNNN